MAQLYLDSLLDGVTERNRACGRGVTERERVNLAELIFYCMRQNPDDAILFINGQTGEKFTSEQILRRAVVMSRALSATTARSVMLLLHTHECLLAAYYGALLAGVEMLPLDPLSGVYEIRQSVELFEPSLIFCETEGMAAAQEALALSGHHCPVLDRDQLRQFTAGHSDRIEDFLVSDVSPDTTALLALTSGSTGLPKGMPLTHGILIARLPLFWTFHTTFPRPTEKMIFLPNIQWTTFPEAVLSCPVFGITLITARRMTAEVTLQMLDQYQATWLILLPQVAQELVERASARQLDSLRTLFILGAKPSERTLHALQEKMAKGAHVCNAYGMSEVGFICLSGPNAPCGSVGPVLNTSKYKLVDDQGQTVEEAFKYGELYVKNDYSIIKSYLNDEATYRESVTADGWWKTGDVLYADHDGNMFFGERKNAYFFNGGRKISPTEMENVILAVPGVRECVVCDTPRGAAAAVVAKGAHTPTRGQVHGALEILSESKRLRGGVAFVPSLPRTVTGKLRRKLCQEMLEDLIARGECF